MNMTAEQLQALDAGVEAIREAATGMFDLKSLTCTVVLAAENIGELDLTVVVTYVEGGWSINVVDDDN